MTSGRRRPSSIAPRSLRRGWMKVSVSSSTKPHSRIFPPAVGGCVTRRDPCPKYVGVNTAAGKGSIPRPGDVDLVCGGPPCQGVSGFNRFRNDDNPLNDPKNMQMPLFMRVIEVLQPTFSLLENVADIWKFPSVTDASRRCTYACSSLLVYA
eukprot:SAG11_NODE_126_length_15729_cov_9.966859_8_plen_152_part_00